MSETDRLDTYRGKRDVRRSGEPGGWSPGRSRGRTRHVSQRHAASSDHYGLRLEVDGVRVSWAVPKGPSTDPRERRMAWRTEDHPLDYETFEGSLADGYGAGQVLVWDRGTWENVTGEDDEPVEPSDARRRPTSTQRESVLSARTLEDIAEEEG